MKKITSLLLVVLTFGKITTAQFNTVFTGVTGNLFDVYFPSENTGYIVGSQAGYPLIFKTTNGGNSWDGSTVSDATYLYGVYFLNDTVGFICGTGGVIQKTTDGGQNWDLLNTGTTEIINSVYFVNDNIGYGVGFKGVIVKTINGGETWDLQTSNTTDFLLSVVFNGQNVGYAVGANNAAVKTIDGGTTWEAFSPGDTNAWTDIFFINETTGFCTGYGGVIVKTSNAGATWEPVTSNTESDLQAVTFLNASTGYVVGDGPTILKTEDGGASWNPETSPVMKDMNEVFMIGNNVVIVGDAGSVLKNQSTSDIPEVLNAQNISYYPNPTRGDLYVEFDTERKNIHVKLMNTMGQVVADEYIGNARQFHIPVNSKNGIYYMEIKTLNATPVMLKVIKE